MSEYAELLKRLDHYADSIQKGIHISGSQMRLLMLELRAALAEQPAAEGEMGELVGLLYEVRSHFTRDNDLPDELLPRIDAALAEQQENQRE